MKRIATIAVTAALAAALVLPAGCKKKTQKAETATEIKLRRGIPVETARVTEGTIDSLLAINGEIKGRNEAPIYPKIGGRVLQILVNNGDRVSKGQVLVRIETKEIQDGVNQAQAAVNMADAAVKQAEAGVRAAQDQVSLVNKGARPQEKLQVENLVEQSKQGFEIAQSNLNRMQTLLASGVVSQQQYDVVKIQYDSAKTGYENAKQQLSIVNTGARDEERGMTRQSLQMAKQGLEQAKQGREQAKAGLSFAREQLKSATIIAPTAGIVSSRIIDPGTLIGPNMPYPILTIVDNSAFTLNAEISETDLSKVRIGQAVSLKVDAIEGKTLTGKVVEINFSPTMGAQTYKIKINIERGVNDKDAFAGLKSGLHANGNIVVEKHTGTLTIPKDAIISKPGIKAGVFVVKDGKAVLKKVDTGIVNLFAIEVTGGLSVMDEVVVVGAAGLRDGDKINVTRKIEK